ncbi:MAG: hypothetical protein HYT08_01290 [Candidatus Levybacteria bacterium]|nr:hypothetical protein [Candidatus Levybacteria bacterium]
MKRDVFIIIFFFAIILFLYRDLIQTFYQQDEWHTLGTLRAEGISYIFSGPSLTGLLLLENRPLARLTNLVLFGQFPLNIIPLFLFSTFFHTINSYLLYKIAYRFIRNHFFSALVVLFFIFNATSKQAVLWFGASTGTLPAVSFILLSILFFLNFLHSKKTFYLIGSVITLSISLGFKENALFLFLLFPFVEFVYFISKKNKVKVSRFSFFFLFLGILIFVLKFLSLFFTVTSNTRYIGSEVSGGLLRLVWAAITYPFESLSQIIIPGEIIFPLSRKVTEIIFPYFEPTGYAGIISEQIIVEFISVLAASLFILPILFFLFSRKEKWPIIFSFPFYLLAFIPFIVLIKPNGYLESRYYYLPAAPLVLIIGMGFQGFFGGLKRITNNIKLSLPIYSVTLFLIGFYLIMNAGFIQDQISFLKERGAIQRHILSEILVKHPIIAQREVIYIESDHSFIVPNNPLPFQNGIGYTLLVVYAYKNNTDRLNPFLLDNFFWKLGNQGYFEKNGQGFGFFTDLTKLKEEIANEKFKKENITAFRYNSEKNEIYDITREIQKKL